MLTPPVALHPGAVLGGVAKSATQCTVCPQQAKGLSSGSRSPTALLDQTKGRLQNKSWGWEIVRSSSPRARKAALKKRRRARRNRGRPVKQVCSDTIEESISSTDEVTPQLMRARVYKGSPPSSTTPPATFTSPFPIPTTAPLTAQSLTTETPSLGLFSPAFGWKQAIQTPSMGALVPCLRLPC